MTDPPEAPIDKLKKLPRKVWISIIAGLAILIVLPLALIQLQRLLAAEELTTDQTEQRDEADNKGDGEPVAQYEDTSPDPDHAENALTLQQRALEQAKLLRIRNQGQRLRKQWEELSIAQDRLSLSLESLQSDDLGRRIASTPELIDRYSVLRTTTQPTATLTKELGEEISILLQPLDQLSGAQIDPGFNAALDDLAQRLEELAVAVKRDERMLEALKSVSAGRDLAEINLRVALEKRASDLAAEKLEEITAAAATARQTEIERISQESAEDQRKIAAAEREIARLQEQQRLADLEAQQQAKQAALAKAALERDFQQDLSQIRSLLKPLITEGLTQPARNSFGPADKKGPVSLAKLRGAGVLEPTAKSRARLYYFVSTNNDRDLGAFPRYFGGAQDVQSKQPIMMRAQELINKYGELMVEKGLLAE